MIFYNDKFFPIVNKNNKSYKRVAIVGIGGNEGNVRKRFRNLYMYLHKNRLVSVSQTSAILKNPPFGYIEQDDFYNAVMVIRTSLSPKAFLKFLLHVEKIFGRKRSFKNAPRTLDLDIIFYDDIRYDDKNLKIPHPSWKQRESVVFPLLNLKRKI